MSPSDEELLPTPGGSMMDRGVAAASDAEQREYREEMEVGEEAGVGGDATAGASLDDRPRPPPLLPSGVGLASRVQFRPVRPTDIPACYELERASYPEDEAASKSKLQYRQHHAAKYFRCAVLDVVGAGKDSHRGEVAGEGGIGIGGGCGAVGGKDGEGEEEERLVGFVCATRCRQFRAESMSTHVPDGELLAIHSVVVREGHRRRGVATAMLKDYLALVVDESISKIVLLAKKELLSFYVDCGFSVTRPSPISHGSDTWYELELDLASQRNVREGNPCYVVDAFAADGDCAGNPAAVVVLDGDRDSRWMQRVALEFNLSETAFLVRHSLVVDEENSIDSSDNELAYTIRYFTPTTEVPLCGHATLASAAVVFDTVFVRRRAETTLVFRTVEDVELRANLSITASPTQVANPSQPRKRSYRITMEFPAKPPVRVDDRSWVERMLQESLQVHPQSVLYAGLSEIGDVLVELTPECFLSIPHDGLNLDALRSCDKYSRGVIICCTNKPAEVTGGCSNGGGGSASDETADPPSAPISSSGLAAPNRSHLADFLSRFFGPKAGIDEDPVTGSAHCVLAPYFASKLDKDALVGMQTSLRGGVVECSIVENGVVQLTGTSVITMNGTLWL
jgi:predicted PhzF superfamily epimerase YddE/YHI9/GNAT superfamily N-acetyltransferase